MGIAGLLEDCLADDFDGFEIVLDDRFAPDEVLDAPGDGRSIKVHWTASRERLVLTLDLCTFRRRPLGTLSLFQSTGSFMLIDTELLKGAFRHALEGALQNAISPALRPVTFSAAVMAEREAPAVVAYFENEV
jgi:hypothetical protein